MILKQFNVHLELTDDGVVHQVSRKEHRLLPYATIAAVDFTEPRAMRLGRLHFRLVEDDTVVGRLGVDKNRVEVAGGSAADLDHLHRFVEALVDRVERAVPKQAHPELDRYCSNPQARAADRRMAAGAALAARTAPQPADGGHLGDPRTTWMLPPASSAAPGATGAPAAPPAAPAAATSTRAERRATEQAESQRSYEQERDRLLQVAFAAAAEQQVVREQNAIEQLLRIARQHGGGKALRAEEERIGDLRRGGDLITTRLLGTVEGESGFERLDRTQRLGQLFELKDPPVRVYSDRVVQGALCHAIDEHTRSAVHLDGEQQKVSNLHLREKRNVDDRRRATFTVSGAGWTMKVAVHPDRLGGPRGLAAQIESIARDLEAQAQRSHTYSVRAEPQVPEPVPVAAPAGASSVVDQLERLQALLSSGALTPAEFAQLKATALAG